MDYKQILNEIKPSKEESREILKTSDKLISYLNEVCKDEGITAHASLVGSVAKKTYLSGKSDIDIFISFPLDVDVAQLKKQVYIWDINAAIILMEMPVNIMHLTHM